mgnify:FL=1
MASYDGCSSFGDLAPEIYIDKVERLPDQDQVGQPGTARLSPPNEVELVKVRLSFRQSVKDQAQKFWFDQKESLDATNIRVVATTNPVMAKRMLYLKERIRKFKLARVNKAQTGLKDLFLRDQQAEIKNLLKLLFRNNIDPNHLIPSAFKRPVIATAAPLGDVQIFDLRAAQVIRNTDDGIEIYQDGTEINKKFSFDVDFRFFKRSNKSAEIGNNRVGIGKSIGNADNEGHLSIFAFCYLDLRMFEGLAPRGMTEFDPITTGGVNFVNVIGSYDESYFDENLQRLFDIKYPGSRPLSSNGDFLGRDEGFEGIYARPEDVFYLDPEIVASRGQRIADNNARARVEERSDTIGLDGAFHSHTNDDGIVSYMPGRNMSEYNRSILRNANENIRPPQVFGPGRQILIDKRKISNIKRRRFSSPLENDLERLFSELSDGIGSFGEKQVNKLFNTESNYFSKLWVTKDHQEDVKLMFVFDLTKFIEDNSPVYHLMKKRAFRDIIESLDYPVYDIKNMKVSRKKVRLRPGAANSLGSGYADDPVDEYNIEEYIGNASPAGVNPKSVSEEHTDKMLRFFYIKDSMSHEIKAQNAGHFQYSAEASIIDNSALVLKAMLTELSRDLLEIKGHRVNIDYGGTLFDANGSVNLPLRQRLFSQTFTNINVLASFLDALIPREDQFAGANPRQIVGGSTRALESRLRRDFDDFEEDSGTYRLMLADLAAESYSGTIESSLESLDALIDVYELTQNSLVKLIQRTSPNFTFTGDPGNLSTGLSEGGSQKVRPLKARKQFEETARVGKYYKCGYEYILPRDTTSNNYREVYNSNVFQPTGFNGSQFRTMNPVTYGKRTGFERMKFYEGDASDDNLLNQSVNGIAGSYLTPVSIRAFGGGFGGDGEIFFQSIKTRNLYGAYKKLLVDLLELQFGNEQSEYYYLRNTKETNTEEQQEQDANRTASLITALSRGSFSFTFPSAFAGAAQNRGQNGQQGDVDNIFGIREKLDEGNAPFKKAKAMENEFNDIDDEERLLVNDRQKAVEKEDRDINDSFSTISDRALLSLFKQFVMSSENSSLANQKFDSIAKVSKRFAERRRIDEALDEGDIREVDRELGRLPLSLRAMIEMSLGITRNGVRLPLYNIDKDKADRLRNQDRLNSLFVSIPDREEPLSVYDPMKDPVKFPAFWLNHKQLVKVEYLAGFYSGQENQKQYSIKQESWRPLPLEVLFGGRSGLQRFIRSFNTTSEGLENDGVSEQDQETAASDQAQQELGISEQDYFICRLVPYETQAGQSLGVKKIDTFDLPIYDQYFILHHGFNYIDQFEGLVNGETPQRIEALQPIVPEPQIAQVVEEDFNLIRQIGDNEEENQDQLGGQMRRIVNNFVQNLPNNLQPEDILFGLNAGEGQPPPRIRNYEEIRLNVQETKPKIKVPPQNQVIEEQPQPQRPERIQLEVKDDVRDIVKNVNPFAPVRRNKGRGGGFGFGGGGY